VAGDCHPSQGRENGPRPSGAWPVTGPHTVMRRNTWSRISRGHRWRPRRNSNPRYPKPHQRLPRFPSSPGGARFSCFSFSLVSTSRTSASRHPFRLNNVPCAGASKRLPRRLSQNLNAAPGGRDTRSGQVGFHRAAEEDEKPGRNGSSRVYACGSKDAKREILVRVYGSVFAKVRYAHPLHRWSDTEGYGP
jgi:hypothetical protein